jgi:hypothetical protein
MRYTSSARPPERFSTVRHFSFRIKKPFMSSSAYTLILTGLLIALPHALISSHGPAFQIAQQINGSTLSSQIGLAVLAVGGQSDLYLKQGTEVQVQGSKETEDVIALNVSISAGSAFYSGFEDEVYEIEILTDNAIATFTGNAAGFSSQGFFWVEEGVLEIMAMRSGQTVSIRNGMFAQADADGYELVTGQLSRDEIRQLRSEYTSTENETSAQHYILDLDAPDGNIIRRNDSHSAQF